MKRKIFAWMSCVLAVALLCGCVGTTVVVGGNCTCGGNCNGSQNYVPEEGEVRTGLAVLTSVTESQGKLTYNVTMTAVAVDANGVITDCVFDGISVDVPLNTVTENWNQAVNTKNELGYDYGMKQWGSAKYEWFEQAENFGNYVKGKTLAQVQGIAVSEGGKPTDADLSASVTISIGDFRTGLEKAVADAQFRGSNSTDQLILSATPKLIGSAAGSDSNGNVQLEMDVTALTQKQGVITSCRIDGLQAKVEFDAQGNISTNLDGTFKTKNELGSDYGMKQWGSAKYEWFEQAENFCSYVKGKTLAQVQGIAVSESGKPTDADLSASVTIAISGFQALLQKALQ